MIDSQQAQEDRTAAVLTHLSGIFFGFIVPLVVWLVAKDTKPYLSNEAKEALNFQITVAIGYVISSLLMLVLIGIFTFFIVYALSIVLCIIAAVKTSQGESYKYPLTLRLIK